MSGPTILALILKLQTTLQGITIAGGYNYDIQASSVVLDPVNIEAVPATQTPFLVVGHRVEPVDRVQKSRPFSIQDRWRIVVEAIVDAPANDNAAKRTACDNLAADFEKAIVAATWPTAGGASGAMYAYVEQHTAYLYFASQARCFVELPVTVLFQRAYGAP